jgi:hypothetical protein
MPILRVLDRSRVSGRAVCVALLCTSHVASAAETTAFAPHRAVYDLTLIKAAPGSGVSDMTGRLVYELTGAACEGYTQSMRFVTQSSSSDGTEQISDMRSTTFEETAGRKLKFTTTQFRDQKLTETTQGQADRAVGSSDVTVELSKPETKAMALPGSIYFPIQHSIAMLEAARAGKSRFVADVYDGSEKGDKVSATNTMIGKARLGSAETWAASISNADKFKSLKAWPVATSYFEKGKGFDKKDSVPNYEMAFHFYENGVSTELTMDYGDFSLRGELKELTFLEQPRCMAGK